MPFYKPKPGLQVGHMSNGEHRVLTSDDVIELPVNVGREVVLAGKMDECEAPPAPEPAPEPEPPAKKQAAPEAEAAPEPEAAPAKKKAAEKAETTTTEAPEPSAEESADRPPNGKRKK